MFDIGADELLLIIIVAVIVIGPKDLPLALRAAGRWIAKMRKISAHFRSGLDAMIREAEMEELEQKWKAQNEKIMREHPTDAPAEMEPTGAYPSSPPPPPASPPSPAAESAAPSAADPAADPVAEDAAPAAGEKPKD